MKNCEAVAYCQGAKIEGFCEHCSCDICQAEPPPLTIFLWKNGRAIKLCDRHVKIVDTHQIDYYEFDTVIFITP